MPGAPSYSLGLASTDQQTISPNQLLNLGGFTVAPIFSFGGKGNATSSTPTTRSDGGSLAATVTPTASASAQPPPVGGTGIVANPNVPFAPYAPLSYPSNPAPSESANVGLIIGLASLALGVVAILKK